MTSIKDVAQLAEVSISTVSIIINGKSKERKISEETQAKVFNAMKELNYQPNLSAKKLRLSDDKKTIALFWTTDFRDIMLARFLGGLQNAIKELSLDYDIIIYPYKTGKLSEEKSLQHISNFHAAIIANTNQNDLDFLATLNPLVPIILYNRQLDKYSSVCVEDTTIAEVAYQLLQNYKNIGVVKAPYVFEGMKTRDNYLIQKLASATIKQYSALENNAKSGYDIASSIDFDSLDVLYTASDMLALGIMHYCHEKRINIPENIKILSIGNGLTQIDDYLNPSLSVIEIPMEEMAFECIQIITKIFNEPTILNHVIEPKVILRKTFN